MFHYSEMPPAKADPGLALGSDHTDLTGRLGGDPKSSTFLPLQVRNVIGCARDSFRGSAGRKLQESQGRDG